jgi:SAM-dependent methyltransferase
MDHYRKPSSFAWYRILVSRLEGKKCLEIGGPSNVFRDGAAIPIYSHLGSWDNVDFAPSTIWSRPVDPSREKVSNGHTSGSQFILDGTQLGTIPSGSYDAVLNSHVIEHLANPIRALLEWHRILNEGGFLLVVVPEGARTFDHGRDPTPLTHFIQDFRNEVKEDDLGHLQEILQSHDAAMDSGVRSREEFVARSRRNGEFRALHHHVFTQATLKGLVSATGFKVDILARVAPFHLLACAKKSSDGGTWDPKVPITV